MNHPHTRLRNLLLGAFGAAFVFGVVVTPVVAAEKPNVILIMVDDLGYGDLSCYGHPKIKTPVLDNMAKEGISLTSFYTGATVCTPSRMALLTGAYPTRLGWTKGVMGYLIPQGCGLSPKAVTIAEVFKSAGYKTAITGKWHLGDTEGFLPYNQGFETCYYIKRSNNQTKELFKGEGLAEKPFDNRMLTEKFSNAAIDFIKKNSGNPFFLYLPYTAPHFPVQAHPKWKGTSQFGEYGDVVEEVDARIGDIFKTLKELKIDENTIVVFLSDNGPQPGQKATADPFRGKKWDALEGGTRVPFIIRYPGVIPAGRKSDSLMAAVDLLPTLAAACGIDLEKARGEAHPIDGLNAWEFLTGKEAQSPRKDLLYWNGRDGFHAIRHENWKLFVKAKGAKLPDVQKGDVVLFDLSKDIKESANVAEQHPAVVEKLKSLGLERLADVEKDIIPFEK